MAKVTKRDREKTRRRTGDSSFPMETATQIRSAIRLRHHGKTKSAEQVLRLASRAITRLERQGKISKAYAERLRRMVREAREKDRKRRKRK